VERVDEGRTRDLRRVPQNDLMDVAPAHF
jgi:hypothetical protein